MTHECNGSVGNHTEVALLTDGTWHLRHEYHGGYVINPVAFCPFCGVKLMDAEAVLKDKIRKVLYRGEYDQSVGSYGSLDGGVKVQRITDLIYTLIMEVKADEPR